MRVNGRAITIVVVSVFMLAFSRHFADAQRNTAIVGEKRSHISSPGTRSSISYQSDRRIFTAVDDPSGKYLRLSLPGHHHTTETGMPELPVYSRLVEIPDGMDLVVTLSDVRYERISLADHGAPLAELFPAQPDRTKNQPQDQKVIFKERLAYEAGDLLRHDTVKISHEGIFRGRRLATLAVYPVFYNPHGRYIEHITSMNMNLSYVPSPSKGESEGDGSGFTKGTYPSDYYVTGYTESRIHMIIVTDSLFKKQLEPLVKWKRRKGIETTVIYRGGGPPDTVYKDLKNRITDLYFNLQASGGTVQYLLIAGDLSRIPSSRPTSNVSDLYYGEFDGNGDYIPELFIGRLPAADTLQLKEMVKKIIDYETFSYDPTNQFWSGAIAATGDDAKFNIYMNGQVSYIYDNYLKPDTSLRPVRWLYPDSPQKGDSLKLLLNQGISLLNYTGHGEATGFTGLVFTTSMVKELANENRYPLVISNACRTAQINVATCFGTAMVTTPGKGAIGFIGCTNDSYWNEDFYWAVGPGMPGLNATPENTGRGAFDRLFHTHDEFPGEWYYTLGQINFSGNMSVSASTSPRKKYYWETYILLGDPSLTPVIGRPDTFDIDLPDRVPSDLQTLRFSARPFSYAAISDFDTLWDASFVSPSGNVSLSIPASRGDSALIVVTGQNMVPYFKTIRFGNVSGAFISAESITFDDSEGNGDGIPDYGEKINLKVTLRNLGKGPSSNLKSFLSLVSGNITLESDSCTIGVLMPGESKTISGKFLFTVSDHVKDGELASLALKLINGEEELRLGIDMTLHAPELHIISSIHDDSSLGNANFLPDPGERLNLKIRVKNSGSSATSGTVTITRAGHWLTIEEPQQETGVILPGEEKTLYFPVEISAEAGSGRVISYDVSFICGNYQAAGKGSLSTGKTRETWEFNRFDIFPWIVADSYPWFITDATSYENLHSARSALIPDRSESLLSIYVNNPVADTLSFYARVSSEPNYDLLTFKIDSVVDMQLSGDTPWAQRKKVLKPGVHLLEWIYSKDVSLSEGLDGAWIDQITFPRISFLETDLMVEKVYVPPLSALVNDIAITGRITNLGRSALTSFPLAYRINDGELVNETFFVKIDPGASADISFTEKQRLDEEIPYTISIINRLPEDGYAGNDTATISFVLSGTGPEISEDKLLIHPNPFRESLFIEISHDRSDRATIDLINSEGRRVMRTVEELSPGMNRITINGRHLPAGVYTLLINIRGKSLTMRAVRY